MAVTAEPSQVRDALSAADAPYARLPSYAATLARDGFAAPGEIAVAGSEEEVVEGLRRYADAGATEVNVSLVGSPEEQARTLAVLGGLRRGSGDLPLTPSPAR